MKPAKPPERIAEASDHRARRNNSGPLTIQFYEKASEPKELVEIEGASHVSLYDNDADVRRAVEAMTVFFARHSGLEG